MLSIILILRQALPTRQQRSPSCQLGILNGKKKKKKNRSLFPNSFSKGLQRDLIGLAWARSHP